MPIFKENKKLEQYFIDKLTEKYSKDRTGIHISDLVYCLKESVFKKYIKRPTDITSLMFFLDGEQRHSGFQGLVPNLKIEDKLCKDGIESTVDLFNPKSNAPANKVIEIKTTRKKPNGEVAPHYIRQGAYYCILRGTNKFTLMTQHINHHAIIFFDVTFSKEELDKYKKEMYEDKEALVSVYSMVDNGIDIMEAVKFLPDIRESMRWKCVFCLYNDLCNPKGEKEKA